MRAKRWGLSLRLWLVPALVAIVAAPTFAGWGIGQVLSGWRQRADQARWAAVHATIGGDVARWRDPAWQGQARARFSALGVEVGLFDKRPGHGGMVFATARALRLMDNLGLQSPLGPGRAGDKQAGARGAGTAAPSSPADASMADTVTYRKIAIADPAVSAGHARIAGVADLWFVRPLPAPPPSWLAPTGGLAALLVTLGVVAIFLNRAVLRPLTAMSRAARLVADGITDVDLPASAAREVAEATTALRIMSTGLSAAARRQADMEQERRLFIGAVAHDLRTPLFTLSAYLNGLRDGVAATPEKAGRYMAVCREQTAQLEHLVTDLFAFATVEYLEQQPPREPLELGHVLRGAVDGLQPRATSHGIDLIVMDPSVPCPLMGDAQSLSRVVANLLDNALRYTPAGGRVAVGWGHGAETHTVFFTIEDTGPGLAVEDLPHLFIPLYRGEASRNRQTGGAGLGLAIAQRIVRAHGGDLTARNGATGGAVFTAWLPVDQGTTTSRRRNH